jgi:hypothetical protein
MSNYQQRENAMQPCTEIVVYKVKNRLEAERARLAARTVMAGQAGFRSWQALSGQEDELIFADIVVWETLEAARAAALAFPREPGCAAFMAQISDVVSMGHYA